MPTAGHTNAIALIVSALRQERCCFILFSHIERISIIMNASVSIFKTNESFDIKNVEPCMTQPISLIAKVWYVNVHVPGCRWRKWRAGRVLLNQRYRSWNRATVIRAWRPCGPSASRWISLCAAAGAAGAKDTGIASRRRNQSGGRTGPLPSYFAGELSAGCPPRYLFITDAAGR